jgi:hypothetical protein
MFEWVLLTELELEDQPPLITATEMMEARRTGTELVPRPLYVRVPCKASVRALVLICSIKNVLPNRAREIYNETEQQLRLAAASDIDESSILRKIAAS